MNFRLLRNYRRLFIQTRLSPISLPAVLVIVALATIGVVASIATKLMITSLPNMILLVVAVGVVDVGSQFAPRTRIVEGVQSFIYGVLYLVTITLCGVIAAYSLQRMAFPLQDHNLMAADRALGFDWFAYAHWIDRHPLAQDVLHFAYHSILAQIFLPIFVLAFTNRLAELRIYLLTFAIAFSCTIVISATMPAAGPIVFVDRTSFDVLRFTGATPIDHLMRLRESGPFILSDMPGGIATFPSFHATIAVLTPLILRKYRYVFIALLLLDAAMLAATITEGAHYFVDLCAGGAMALFAYAVAKRIIGVEDRLLDRCAYPTGEAAPASAH